jgi:hypothetical protein
MKISLTKLSSNILIFCFSGGVWAKPVAQVVEVAGTVFVVNSAGKTSALRPNQQIEEKSEVLVGEDGSVTVNDYFDSTYHLTSGSHLKFFNKSVQLKKGKSWIQAMNARHPLALTTANSHVDFMKGEFITTFDHSNNRTQVLVVSGDIEVSNILDKNFKFTVSAGTFTTVDPEVENGVPRTPTRVGLQSLDTALSEFKKLPKVLLEKNPSERSPASVEETRPQVFSKKGEIIFITSERKPASVDPTVAKKYLTKVMRKKIVHTPVPIKIYGLGWSPNPAPETPRSPASLPQVPQSTPKIISTEVLQDPQFADSLKKHESEQPKHSKELQSLIDELRSY